MVCRLAHINSGPNERESGTDGSDSEGSISGPGRFSVGTAVNRDGRAVIAMMMMRKVMTIMMKMTTTMMLSKC